MAAVRRTICSAAAAGRYGLGTPGSRVSLQHVRPSLMATICQSLPAASSAGNFGLGILGLQARNMSRPYGSMPIWISQHQKVAVNPEQAFLNLSPQEKDMLVLTYLLVSDGTMKVCQFHAEGLKSVLSRFATLYDKQEQLEQGLWALVCVAGVGVVSFACFVKGVKDESALLLGNLASNAGDIMAALVGGAKHAAGSWFLGKGAPLVVNPEWLKKKKSKDELTEPEDKKNRNTKPEEKDEAELRRRQKYLSRFFTQPDDKDKPNK